MFICLADIYHWMNTRTQPHTHDQNAHEDKLRRIVKQPERTIDPLEIHIVISGTETHITVRIKWINLHRSHRTIP